MVRQCGKTAMARALAAETGAYFLKINGPEVISKKAIPKARRSVSEKDLAQFEEFAEKQKAGRGEESTNFKLDDASGKEGEEEELNTDELYE